MAVLLALGAALSYGLADFIGGVASRRTSPWPVALLTGVGGLLGAVVLALAVPGSPTAPDLWWALLAGAGSGFGGAFLYRGFAAGRMGVVAPISAVGAALLPMLVGVTLGERPSMLAWLGIATALPGIWLVSKEPSSDGVAAGIVDGVVAGVGFGMLFIGMAQVSDRAGYWPLALAHVVVVVTVAATAMLFRSDWVPRAATDWWGVVAGLLAMAAVVGYALATQRGLITISAVLTSLYPAFTIALAHLVLHERIHRAQAVGLVLCAVAVGLVAAG